VTGTSHDDPGGDEPGPPSDEEPIVISYHMLATPPPRPDGRVDFESGMSYAPRVTLVLIIANILVFAWELATGALASKESIIAAGALSRDAVLQGEIWRLVTPMFLHGDEDHLIGNCIALYVMGMALEHAVGTTRMLSLYLASGVAGACASMALSEGPSVGASGAIFGVMAAVAVVLYRHQDRFYLREKRTSVVVAAWALFTVATGLLSPYVDNAAHVGGFLCGALVARYLEPIYRVPV
jgi:rhomboid protease GluP